MYAPCLQVAGSDITAHSFSIPISDQNEGRWIHRFINLRCEWSETPECLLDYWNISVSCEDHPTSIEVRPDGAIVSPCTVSYYAARPIEKIEIHRYEYTCGENGNKETVSYDQAILLYGKDSADLCFACRLNGPGIATEMHVSDDKETISDFLKYSQLRVTL
jgi:hypothetical protein